jgi:hypothetical protein
LEPVRTIAYARRSLGFASELVELTRVIEMCSISIHHFYRHAIAHYSAEHSDEPRASMPAQDQEVDHATSWSIDRLNGEIDFYTISETLI